MLKGLSETWCTVINLHWCVQRFATKSSILLFFFLSSYICKPLSAFLNSSSGAKILKKVLWQMERQICSDSHVADVNFNVQLQVSKPTCLFMSSLQLKLNTAKFFYVTAECLYVHFLTKRDQATGPKQCDRKF